MPSFNQLVRKGRETSIYKSNSPALQKGKNTLKGQRDQSSLLPRREVSAPPFVPKQPPKSPTPHCVRSPAVRLGNGLTKSPLTSPVLATTCRNTPSS